MTDGQVIGLLIFTLYPIGFLCGFLFAKLRKKYAGDLEVTKDAGGIKRYSLVLNSDPDNLDQFREVIFHVKTTTSPS